MSVTYTDLTNLWGAGNVVRVERPLISSWDLPPDAMRVLTEVGLPKEIDSPIFVAERPAVVAVEGLPGSYCRFGNDFGTSMCVSVETGEVWSTSPESDYPNLFVNSSLPAYVECLYEWATERDDDESADDYRRVVIREERLRAVDARAFADEETYWPRFVEGIKDYL